MSSSPSLLPSRQTGERQLAVVQQVSEGDIPREGFSDLLGGPCRRWMCRHRDVHHTAAIVRQQDQDEQYTPGDRWDHEEIGGRDLLEVAGQEGPPRLRRR